MPNKLSKYKVRVSYAEEAEVRAALERMAKDRDITLSDIIKEATADYLSNQANKRDGKENRKKEKE